MGLSAIVASMAQHGKTTGKNNAMKKLLFAMLFWITPAMAQSDAYLCFGANGKKEYKNTGTA